MAGLRTLAVLGTLGVSLSLVAACGRDALEILPTSELKMLLVDDAPEELVGREDAEQVSECMLGGDLGRPVTYVESDHATRERNIAVIYNWKAAEGLGLPADPHELSILGPVVTSATARANDAEGFVPAGGVGAFYRQAVRINRLAKLIAVVDEELPLSEGGGVELGDVYLEDWRFETQLALADACPPEADFPPGDLGVPSP